jgi:hypothetical protein
MQEYVVKFGFVLINNVNLLHLLTRFLAYE